MSKFIACFLAVALSCTAASAQPPTDAAKELLAVASNGYRANLEAFEFFTCRYTVKWGQCASLEDSVEDKFLPGAVVTKAVMYKRDGLTRFRIEEDEQTKSLLDTAATPTPFGSTGMKSGPVVPFNTVDILKSDAHGLSYMPRNLTANIFPADSEKGRPIDHHYFFTPLRVGTDYDLGLLAERSLRGDLRFDASRDVAGNSIVTTFHTSDTRSMQFATDPARGFLPVRAFLELDKGAKGGAYTVIPQARSCSKGRWFPERIVTFAKSSAEKKPYLTYTYTVTELDVDKPPTADAVTIELPAGTAICQFSEPHKHFVTRRVERIRGEDLPRIQQLTVEVPQTPQMDTAIVLPRSTWYWWVLGGCGVVVLVWVIRKRLVAGAAHAS